MSFEAIVVGVSSGGMNALKMIFSRLPEGFSIPIIIVQHIGANSTNSWIKLLNEGRKIAIQEAEEKDRIANSRVYIAPANYHLLIESDKTFSLTIDERVNYARPSIDVLFESAAEAYKDKLIGVVLTGANNDGAKGLGRIRKYGGLTIVQDPKDAEASYMPESAIALQEPDHILSLTEIVSLLIQIDKNPAYEFVHKK